MESFNELIRGLGKVLEENVEILTKNITTTHNRIAQLETSTGLDDEELEELRFMTEEFDLDYIQILEEIVKGNDKSNELDGTFG